MAYDFNGSTLTFDSASVGRLRSLDFSSSGAKVDVTDSADSEKKYEAGIPDLSLTAEVVGGTSLSIGDSGALVVAWTDTGSLGSITSAVVTDISVSGSMDGEILSTVTFVPLDG